MADRSNQVLLEALSRAVADPGGVPLYAHKKGPGLFAPTAANRVLAEHCKDEGLVRVLARETRGKSVLEVCAITEKGLSFLLEQTSPRQVLEDLVRAVDGRGAQVAELIAAAQRWQVEIEGLKALLDKLLHQAGHSNGAPLGHAASRNGAETWKAELLAYLREWHASGASSDCPLPQLFRRLQQSTPGLTVGKFHDGLRQLHDQGQLYLHPWTGPLYEIPEPPCALLVGHEIAYYASAR